MDESVSLLAARLLTRLDESAHGCTIVVVDGEQKAEALCRLLGQMAPDLAGQYVPAWDCLPYDRAAPSSDLSGHRMRVLADLSRHAATYLITTPEAIIQRVPPRDLVPAPLVLRVGSRFSPETFAADLARLGYRHADKVEDPAQFAIRGEVVDVFAAASRPYRITVEEGRITALHRYDPGTQRSTGTLEAIRLDAMSEAVLPNEGEARFEGIEHWWPELLGRADTLFDAVAAPRLMIAPQAEAKLASLFASITEAYDDRMAADKALAQVVRRALKPARLYMDAAEWTARTEPLRVDGPDTSEAGDVPRFCLMDKPGPAFTAFLKERIAAGHRVVLAGARERELDLMAKQVERGLGTVPTRAKSWRDPSQADAPEVAVLHLCADHGFVDEKARITLVTAADLLGHHARTLSPRTAHVPWHFGDGDFALDDLVIHLDHGVCLLKGLEHVEGGGAAYDAVRLGFADGADLLVPTDDLGRVWRYAGPGSAVSLDHLGGQAWPKRKAKLAKDIAATAADLVALARQRRQGGAPKLVPSRRDYERFVAGFGFAPTADQMHAIDDCLRDLAGEVAMDRLVVGDVGFGKTEVALRAAAAAVLAGRQVAVVVPTTVLARQHVACFRKRFEALGIATEQLSRCTPTHEVERICAGLADGTVRLVIGTQALCGEDIRFAQLGLLIVDEEQRFGTADKARLRALGAGVHVLTLTATPIPRTLQSALVGLQDISIIATPPARRRPIRTLLTPFDAVTIRTALLKERARAGQSFVVVPRIEDLDAMAAQLSALVPELTLRQAHGQMAAAEIEDAMMAFAAGDGDVLLATSIIESGLDVPRANTMVICRADRFGLAELHQMRGRVGRGRQQGVCYLMTEPDHALAAATERRLMTLARLDRLGSGMAISAQDLDARGAGDLGGSDQAGHSHLIGLGLYQHLLQRALREADAGEGEDWMPELHLGDAGALAADYIPEAEVRLNLYVRLARVTDTHDVDCLAEEMEDRFGPMPAAAQALFARARLRSLCRSRQIARLDAGPKAIALTPRAGTAIKSLRSCAAAEGHRDLRVKNGRLLLAVEGSASGSALKASTELLQALV